MKLVVLLSEMVERDWRILRCLVQGGPFELKHSLQFFIFLTLFFAGCASDSEFGDGSSLGNSSRSRTTTRVTGENSPTSNSLPNAGLTTQTQNVFTQGEIRIAHLDIRGKRMYRDSFLKQAQSIICNSNPQNVRWSKVPENQSQFELIPEPEKPCQAVVSIPQDILPLPANPILGKVVAKYQAVEGVAVTTEFPIRYQPPISLENYAMGYWATGDIYGYTCSRAAGNEPNIEFDISRIKVKDEYGSKDLLISGSCSLSFNRSADTDYVDPDYGSKDYRSNARLR